MTDPKRPTGPLEEATLENGPDSDVEPADDGGLFVDDDASIMAQLAGAAAKPVVAKPAAQAAKPAPHAKPPPPPPRPPTALKKPAEKPVEPPKGSSRPLTPGEGRGPPQLESKRPLYVTAAAIASLAACFVLWVMWPHIGEPRGPLASEPGYAGVARYVQQTGERVTNHMPGGTPYFNLVRDASVMAGVEGRDKVVVAHGALRRLRSEAQLAALLAHLAAHVAKGKATGDDATEAMVDEIAQTALERAGYSPTAYAEVLELFGPQSPYAAGHPVSRELLTKMKARKAGGTVGDKTYEERVLDRVGKSSLARP